MPAPSVGDLLEALPNGVALLDADARIFQSNAALAGLIGVSPAGRTVLEATRNDQAQRAAAAAVRGEKRRLELEVPATRRSLVLSFAPVPGGALLNAQDVTASKRMEAARRDFVANASHELRTPVTAIAGAAETLLSGAIDDRERGRQFVEIIARHAERLSHLTRSLLDLSRIESGEWRVDVQPLDAKECAAAAVDLERVAAERRSTALKQEVPADTWVQADRRALEQVLINLVDNAVKHTPPGGTVTVSAQSEADAVVLSVTDTGPGIDRHHVSRIFERFYRVDPGRAREAGGAGLGLAIVKHLVEAQEGTVGVESGGGGSRFWVRLRPAARR
jgi:two-component system phosphate regulon sensor histidine kinase PhoR